MRKNVNLNTLISSVVAGLLIWLVNKVDENYSLLIRVKINQDAVMIRLDNFETRVTTLQVQIARVAAEVEMLKAKDKP